jgi:MFS family permease
MNSEQDYYSSINIKSQESSLSIRRKDVRWMVLFIVALAASGSYFSTNIQTVLIHEIEEKFGISDSKFVAVFEAAYSISNVFWPFFVGKLADKYTFNCVFIMNSVLITLGQFISWYGVYLESLLIIFFG